MDNNTTPATSIQEYIDQLDEEMKNRSKLQCIIDDIEVFWINTKTFFYNVRHFFRNLWLFRKQMWKWRSWDSAYQMELFAFGLEQVAISMEKGPEERKSANKKIAACRELVMQLRRNVDDEIEWRDDNMDEVREYIAKATLERFDRIAYLLKGQDPKEYDKLDLPNKDSYDTYVEWFDGSGIESWWD